MQPRRSAASFLFTDIGRQIMSAGIQCKGYWILHVVFFLVILFIMETKKTKQKKNE